MPNHIQNVITFGADVPQERLDEVFSRILSLDDSTPPTQFFDFNKLIPMPKSLGIESSTDTEPAILLYRLVKGPKKSVDISAERDALAGLRRIFSRAGISFDQEDAMSRFIKTEEGQKLFELGKKSYFNQLSYSAPNWYDWCIHNWGTKWNSYSNKVDTANRTLTFQTAWACPTPIVAALSDAFPDVEFVWRYADEDFGYNTGVFTYKSGEMDYTEFEGGSDEGRDMYVACWGVDGCMYKDNDGHWQRYDCDSCPNKCY